MQRLILIISLMGILSTTYAQEYKLDVKESMMNWKGYGEIGGFEQVGTIDFEKGSLKIDGEKITAADLAIDMKSIKSEDLDLTKHLKQKDFFYVKKYPESTFKMIAIEDGILQGELTMRGITKEISIPIQIYFMGDEISVQGTVSIDRTQFEIKYNSSSYFQDLGNYAIKNEFDLSFNLNFSK